MAEDYKNSMMDSLTWNSHERRDVPTVVSIENGHITVTYSLESEQYRYTGTERGEGHFELRKSGDDGRATLHRAAASLTATPDQPARILEGSWVEGQTSGMWKIRLL